MDDYEIKEYVAYLVRVGKIPGIQDLQICFNGVLCMAFYP